MNRLIECTKMVFHYFTIITVASMVVAASYITIFYGSHVEVEVTILWQILFVAFLCSLSCLFFGMGKKELSRKQFWFRWIICYVYVNIVVLGFGTCFAWFQLSSLPMLMGMMFAIIIAFVIIALLIFLIDLKTTDEINQKLRERNGEAEENCQ